MIVRCGHGQRMIVVHTRHKRTNYKIMGFEVLMNRRGKMYSARDRFKVFNIKFIRIEITVPTYNIERMGCINEIPDLIFVIYFDEEFTFCIFSEYKWENGFPKQKEHYFHR